MSSSSSVSVSDSVSASACDSASDSAFDSASTSFPYANLWPRGTVYWKYGRRAPTAAEQARFEAKLKKAMARWEQNTCIRFFHKASVFGAPARPAATDIVLKACCRGED